MKGLPAEEHSALESRLKGALCLEINIQRFTFRFIMTYLHPAILCPHILLSNRTLRTTPSKCTNATSLQVPSPPSPKRPTNLGGTVCEAIAIKTERGIKGGTQKTARGDTLMRHVTQSCGKYCIAANTIDKTPSHAAQILA